MNSVTLDVKHCARCNEDHEQLVFVPFKINAYDAGDHICTHWAACPTTGDPILMHITDEPFDREV